MEYGRLCIEFEIMGLSNRPCMKSALDNDDDNDDEEESNNNILILILIIHVPIRILGLIHRLVTAVHWHRQAGRAEAASVSNSKVATTTRPRP